MYGKGYASIYTWSVRAKSTTNQFTNLPHLRDSKPNDISECLILSHGLLLELELWLLSELPELSLTDDPVLRLLSDDKLLVDAVLRLLALVKLLRLLSVTVDRLLKLLGVLWLLAELGLDVLWLLQLLTLLVLLVDLELRLLAELRVLSVDRLDSD